MKILCGKYFTAMLVLFFFFAPQLSAFYYPPITYLGIEQGLSNNAVRCIYQDHKGFMWFGTYDGLNRYDGNEFKVFRNKFNDGNSLINNWVLAINEDAANNLWIGTRQGISLYNSVTEKFDNAYFIPFEGRERRKITAVIRDIRRDDQGNMLITTEGQGLLFFSNGMGTARQIPFIQGKDREVNYDAQAIETDGRGNIWIFILKKGLCRFDGKTMQLTMVNNTLSSATCLKRDGQHLWVGTSDGLYKYDISTNTYTEQYSETERRLTYNKVTNLFLDKAKTLWIATNGGGINILNTITGQWTYLLPGNNNYSITSESVYAIYEDRDGRKWIGTLRGGINIIDPRKDRFQTIAHDPLNVNSVISNFIFSFCEAPDSSLWIGTDGGGLSKWDRRNNKFTNYRHSAVDPTSLSDNFITGIETDESGDTWIATFGGGLNRFDKTTHRFRHYACINTSSGIENKTVYNLYKDKPGRLWAGTLHEGALYLYNRKMDRFDLFDTRLTDLLTMSEDLQGNLWAGNLAGLVKIGTEAKKHVFFDMGKPVRAIHEDRQGNFWLGTEGGGLILFDRQQGKITARYTTDEGLANNAVLNILEDNNGCLWMSTFNGISKFNTVQRQCTNYYQGDGLPGNQFNYTAALALRSGEFAFGGIKGFSLFRPENILPATDKPAVLLTGLRINNIPLARENALINEKDNDEIKGIKVSYKQAVFSFDFTALEYSSPNKISYAYYMQGWDHGWNYVGNNRAATYTHLDEGNYLFRIKCTNAEGVWNKNEVALKIMVLPPWYRSWWAYALYLLIAVAVIYFYWHYRARQAKLEYEIKIAHLDAEKEKEMNEKKLSFFTNISHEFRAPLTLIINPVKELLDNDGARKETDISELNIVYRNARRLLSLVDQLLLFRKSDSAADKFKPAKLHFYNLCREVYLCFIQQARSKKIDYAFIGENVSLEIYADREKTEIILYNLISNALKYTPDGGKVSITISETSTDVTVLVEDNGYGIPKEAGDQLFEKFYQPERKDIPVKSGFGIGLYLVRHFTEQHKGKISYYSEPEKGTGFILELRKGTEHFGRDMIVEENPVWNALPEVLPGDADMEKIMDIVENDPLLTTIVTEKQAVLVVDDDEQIRQYVAGIFRNKFTVYEAASGEQGMAQVKEYLPDIIICDIKMSGISGIELCKTIKEDNELNHIPVILLTSSSAADTRLEGVEGGADDYITKPFEKELLVARVTNLLKSRNNLQKYFYSEITLNRKSLKISAEYKEFLEKCISIVEKHLEDDDFGVKTLLSELGMSHSNLFRRVKSVSGQSINVFIRFIRLRKAAELFINTNYNVNEIAFQVGINDTKYFREQFNKVFGMNPSEYIKKYRWPFNEHYTVNRESFNYGKPPAKK